MTPFESLEPRRLLSAGGFDPFFADAPVTVGPPGRYDAAGDVAVDASGNVTVGGVVGGDDGTGTQMLLARHTARGDLDPTFGDGGLIRGTPRGIYEAASIAVLPDGSMLVAGRNATTSARLLKLDARGRVDESFGKGGVALFEATDYFTLDAPHVALRDDGRIFFAVEDRLYLLDADGRRDATFAAGGLLDLAPGLPSQTSSFDGQESSRTAVQRNIGRLAVAPGGDAIVFSNERVLSKDAGGSVGYVERGEFARVDAAGTVTPAVADPPDSIERADFALAADGSIVTVEGGKVRRDGELVLSLSVNLYTPGGQEPDPRTAENRQIRRIAVQADGKLLVVSTKYTEIEGGRTAETDLRRYLPDGSPDLAFGGGDGVADLDDLASSSDHAFAFGPGGSIHLAYTRDPLVVDTGDGSPDFVGVPAVRVVRLFADDGPVGQVTARPIRGGREAGRPYRFRVDWRSDAPIDAGSIDDRDLQIVGPAGQTYKARRVGLTPIAGQPDRLVTTYKFTPPGGMFGPADSGVYDLRLRGGEVLDADGDAAIGRVIGHIYVDIPMA